MGLFGSLMFSFLSSLYFEDQPSVKCGAEDLCPLCKLPFCLIDSILCLKEVFSFMRSHLLFVALRVYATGVIFRKWCPLPMGSRLLSTLFSIRFSVTGFMLKSLIQMYLIFVHGDR